MFAAGMNSSSVPCYRYDAPLYMKVTQKVRRKSDEKEVNGEPKWHEDDIYEDVAIEKAYVGRVSRASCVCRRTANEESIRSQSCCVPISV
jgi:hypothetical protein